MHVLVLNVGSSSLKFQLIRTDADRIATEADERLARGQVERIGGVKWTIKDGIVYDAKKLMADVATMVEKQKAERAKK